MIRKLAIRSLQRGISSMNYIETLFIIQNHVLFQYGRCHLMPQEVKRERCKLKKGRTPLSQFTNLYLDPDVVELCIKNTGDIRNNREDNSSRTFQKAPIDNLTLPVMVILVKKTNNSALHV